jgi:2-polyprenyl-3-methyl-5-hydroxy-6-metoxy-1,4-benzoquinol methylase
MMYGFKDNFIYLQCTKCNSLNIAATPVNLEKYYQKDYYSFNVSFNELNSSFKSFLVQKRTKFLLENNSTIGRLINYLKKDSDPLINYLIGCKASLNSSILDIGAGNGMQLFQLYKKGFKNLTGIDPFIEKDISFKNHFKVFKKDISIIGSKKYDIILLNHVIEHVPDPDNLLRLCNNILSENGKIIVRTPVLNCYAWEYYKENWVQLDAPRHLTIFTESSLIDLATKNHFKSEYTFYDSYEFQFWGSELYTKDIPLVNKNTHNFSAKELAKWKTKSIDLNNSSKGDQAAFIFSKNR